MRMICLRLGVFVFSYEKNNNNKPGGFVLSHTG
jgi:hypothetical protein